jgi:hypothetical protein
MHHTREEPSLGDLFGDLSRQIAALFRQEMRLATREVSENLSGVGRDVGMIAAGGLVAYGGLLAIIAALIILLAQAIPWWTAALVTGVLVMLAGYLLLRRGLAALQRVDLVPRGTVRSIQKDVAAVKGEAA